MVGAAATVVEVLVEGEEEKKYGRCRIHTKLICASWTGRKR